MTQRIKTVSLAAAVVIIVTAHSTAQTYTGYDEPIRVGILHSISGTMADSEAPLIDAARLAIQEINAAGGVLGRRLVPIIEDGHSDTEVYKQQVSKMLQEQRVVSVFGCWTSVCRKAVTPIIADHKNLLWYPVQYEGQESSPWVIYTGAAPNQQILPALKFGLAQFGPRVLFVGTDSVFPKVANDIVKAYLQFHKNPGPVAEIYRPFGDWNFSELPAAVSRTKPDWVFNTVNGDSNVALFKTLASAGLRTLPVMSVSLAEVELSRIGIAQIAGHYAAWNYFQSIDSPENRNFVSAFKSFTALERVTDDPIEAAYFQIHLFAKAARKARSTDPVRIRDAVRGMEMLSPGGWIRVDPENQHTWKTARIGKIGAGGQFTQLWSSVDPVQPEPYQTWNEPQAPPISEQALDTNLIALLSEDGVRARYAARRLGELPTKSQAVIDALGRAVHHRDWLVRRNAADALVSAGKRGVPPLVVALKSQEDLVRATAAHAMAQLGEAALPGMSELVSSLDDRDIDTREEALKALAQIGPAAADAVNALLRQAGTGDPRIKLLAVDALGRIGAGAKETLPYLTNQFAAGGLGVREHSARAVWLIADDLRRRNDTSQLPALGKFEALIGGPLGGEVPPEIRRDLQTAGETLRAIDEARVGARLLRQVSSHSWFWTAVFLLLLYVLAAAFFRIVGVHLFPMWIIRANAGLDPISEIKISALNLRVPLDKVFALGWCKDHPRVLDAWISKHATAVRANFQTRETVRDRSVYVSLPISINNAVYESASVPTFRSLLDVGRWAIVIWGEGGSGKTALACQIAAWACDENPRARLNPDWTMLPVLIEPGLGEATIGDVHSLLNCIRGQLQSLIGTTEPISDYLITALLRKRRIVLIVDDIRELLGATSSEWVLPSHHDFPIAALVVTSRVPEKLGGVSAITVQPLRITDASVLTSFITGYLNQRGYLEKINQIQLSRACIRLFKLQTRRDAHGAITALLAKMYAEQLIGVAEAGEPASPPKDIPSLFIGYVNEVNRRSKNELTDDRAVHKASMTLAWACVRERLRPSQLDRREAAALLEHRGGEQMLRYLESGLGLLQIVGARKDQVRFSLDPLAEYLAAIYLVDEFGHDEVRWREFLSYAAEIKGQDPAKSEALSFLLALRDCCIEPGRYKKTPLFVAQSLGVIAGLDWRTNQPLPVRIGILHSLSGPMAISERPLVDAAKLAIKEINDSGGVLGRPLEAITEDGESDEHIFRHKAAKLVDEHGVWTVFGCWTSVSRKAVLPIFEERNHLLWYPIQYEGLEASPNVIYTGSAPNQQIIPAVDYCLEQLKRRRFLLVGSDNLFPRKANQIIRQYLSRSDAVCVAEQYQPLDRPRFDEVLNTIRRTEPDVIFNTFNGAGNNALFQALRDFSAGPEVLPVMSVSIAEVEFDVIGWDLAAGHYCTWSYFEELSTPSNTQFKERYRREFGRGTMISDPIEAAYTQVHLFALAANKAGSVEPRDVRAAARGMEYEAPGGTVRVDEENQHLWKVARVGRVRPAGGIEIVWSSQDRLRPDPYLKAHFPEGFGPAVDRVG